MAYLTPGSMQEELMVVAIIASIFTFRKVKELRNTGSERVITLVFATGALALLLSGAAVCAAGTLISKGFFEWSMLGAVLTWMAMEYFGINYWVMLIAAPIVIGLFGVLIERLLLRWIYKLDHLYGLYDRFLHLILSYHIVGYLDYLIL